jgi:hypothetical protein
MSPSSAAQQGPAGAERMQNEQAANRETGDRDMRRDAGNEPGPGERER